MAESRRLGKLITDKMMIQRAVLLHKWNLRADANPREVHRLLYRLSALPEDEQEQLAGQSPLIADRRRSTAALIQAARDPRLDAITQWLLQES